MAKRGKRARLNDLLATIEEIAPASLAESYDNVGLQIGDRSRPLKRVVVGLEVNDTLIDEALKAKADTIVTHHPLFFLPIKRLEESDHTGHLARRLVKHDIALVAAHTNLDKAPKGTNPVLAKALGLEETKTLLPEAHGKEFKYAVFVPEGHEAKVIEAIAKAGGGVIGDYDHCTFRTRGTGTFRGGEGTNPAIGEAGQLESAEEFRLEAVVPQRCLGAVIEEVRRVHPYEEVAFDVFPLEPASKPWGLGVEGKLSSPMSLAAFAKNVKRRLGVDAVRVVGDLEKEIKRVAVGSGACEFLIRTLSASRVDCLVTGDVKYHMAVEARAKGLAVIDPGHWASEVIIAEPLAKTLQTLLAERGLEVEISAESQPEPDPFTTVQ